MARKKPPRRLGLPRRLWNRLGPFKALAALAFAALLGFGNWFAHQPAAERAAFGGLQPALESLGAATADFTDNLGLTGRDASVPYTLPPEPGPLPFGIPRVADPSKTPDDLILLKRKGYWLGYSPTLRRAAWAAYALPVRKVLDYPPERPPFFLDTEVRGSPRPEDYTGSGYDRGHLAPNYAIATRYGRIAQKETFLMTNIVPQKADLNRGPWRLLEQIVADDLTAPGDTVYAIVAMAPGSRHLRRGGVQIPAGMGMVLAAVHEGRLRAIALYMPQETPSRKLPRYCFCSVRDLERLTGLDFFPALSRARQDALETPAVTRFWPKYPLFR